MISKAIREAQRYLTCSDGFAEQRIADIVSLSERHGKAEILLFLMRLYKEKREALMLLQERAFLTGELDRALGALFRLHMAIRIIRDELEEENYAQAQQRTGTGGCISAWNMLGHRGSGFGQDPCHDAPDRETGQRA